MQEVLNSTADDQGFVVDRYCQHILLESVLVAVVEYILVVEHILVDIHQREEGHIADSLRVQEELQKTA